MSEGIHITVLVRIWMFGEFCVECRQADGTWKAVPLEAWGGNTYSRRLLKVLLCHERCARRGTIMEEMWPGNDSVLAEEYLNKAARNVRQVLQKAVEGQESVLKTINHRSTYELADQSQVWVDADACQDLMRKAEHLGYTSSQGLALLQEAQKYFARGRFLEGEDGIWCHGKRSLLDTARYRCTLWLAEAYEEQGKLKQAEEQISELFQRDPTDEDVLYRLMLLLHKQGMTHRALCLYRENRHLFEREGLHLSPACELLAEQLQREPSLFEIPLTSSFRRKSVQYEQTSKLISPPYDIIVPVQNVVYQEHKNVLANQQAVVSQQIGSKEIVNRREATQRISELSLALFASPLMTISHQLHKEEILALCATNIPICWRLYFDGHLSEVQQILFPVHLSQLAVLVAESHYQERAASLASKSYQLAALIEMHHQNLGNALTYAKQGTLYGELAKDPNLHIAALIQQGNIYFNLKQPWRELEAYQQAHQICQETTQHREVSPLLQGRVVIGLAKSYSKLKEEQQALRFLEDAYKKYPETPEEDSAFHYTCHTRFTLRNHTGLTYLNLGRFNEAWDIFADIDAIVPKKLIPRRMELLIRQATLSFALGNLKECCAFLEQAATSAIALGSDLRFNEAYELYLLLREKWSNEPSVKALGKYFHASS